MLTAPPPWRKILFSFSHSQNLWNLNFFTGLGPCLPNNLSTYGARRFHISRSEWDRVFSRLTVVPGLSWFPIDEQEGKWNDFVTRPRLRVLWTLRPPATSGSKLAPYVGWGKRAFPLRRIQSSHRFPYGYLVTTSPQSKTPPWYAPIRPPKAVCGTSGTQKSWVIIGPMLRAKPIPRVWRAVCTGPGYIFTAACWSAITSDSNFMFPSCREQSELRQSFRIRSALQPCFPL